MAQSGAGYPRSEAEAILGDPAATLRALRVKQRAFITHGQNFSDVRLFERAVDVALGLEPPKGKAKTA